MLDMDFVLTIQNPHTYEQFIIYADTCVLSDDYLRMHHATFKQIPRDIHKL